MEKDLVSIIVPIYNTSNYLYELIKSIQKQKYKNLEIILIDDGSTDNSREICEKFGKKDNRVLFFSKENEGVSIARNFGLDKAKGKYIFFADSDDILDENCILNFISEIKDYDLICAGYYEMFKNKIIEKKITNAKGEIEKDDFLKGVLNNNNIKGFLWNKFFRKDIIDKFNIKFEENINFLEDTLFVCNYIKYCNKICMIPSTLYYYRMRKSSIVNSSKNIESVNNIYIKLKPFCNNIIEIYWYNYLLFYFNNKEDLHNLKNISKKMRLILFSKQIDIKCKVKLLIYRISPNIFKNMLKFKQNKYELFN